MGDVRHHDFDSGRMMLLIDRLPPPRPEAVGQLMDIDSDGKFANEVAKSGAPSAAPRVEPLVAIEGEHSGHAGAPLHEVKKQVREGTGERARKSALHFLG